MKALLSRHAGGPETLKLEDIDEPVPGAGQVRVAVRAVGVNFPDLLIIKGEYQFKPPLPFAPGGEVSGVVLEVGSDVQGFAPGDRVLGMQRESRNPRVGRAATVCAWDPAAGFSMALAIARFASRSVSASAP